MVIISNKVTLSKQSALAVHIQVSNLTNLAFASYLCLLGFGVRSLLDLRLCLQCFNLPLRPLNEHVLLRNTNSILSRGFKLPLFSFTGLQKMYKLEHFNSDNFQLFVAIQQNSHINNTENIPLF